MPIVEPWFYCELPLLVYKFPFPIQADTCQDIDEISGLIGVIIELRWGGDLASHVDEPDLAVFDESKQRVCRPRIFTSCQLEDPSCTGIEFVGAGQ